MQRPTHQRRDPHGLAERGRSALRHASRHVHSPIQTIIDIEPQHCFDAITVISLDWFEVCPIDLWTCVFIGDAHLQMSAVVSHTTGWAAQNKADELDRRRVA